MKRENILVESEMNSVDDRVKTVPYAVYEHLGEYFLYDTTNCVFFNIDAPTKGFLELCLENSFEDAAMKFLSESKWDSHVAMDVIKQVSLMRENGLFNRPNNEISKDTFEKLLDNRYATAWTKLELSLSEGCNLACKYCYCATGRDMPSKGLMPEKIAKLAITWLFAVSGKSKEVSITFFGGEPLLNKDVLKVSVDYSQYLAKLHGKKVFYSMTTNGTLIDDEIIAYIKRYNFGLMVSLDGPKCLHDNQCPTRAGDGSYDLAVNGIKRLMSKRRHVTVCGTMIHPIPNVMELVKFYEDFGFTRMVISKSTNPINPSGVDFTDDDFKSFYKQEREEIIPWLIQKINEGEKPKYNPYGPIINNIENNNIRPKVSPFRCGACRGTTTVGADGALYPCHRFVGMEKWIIGNILSGPDIDKCKEF